jgi:hypothetical protein
VDKPMNRGGSITFRPETPMRVLWIVMTLVFGLAGVGLLSDAMPSDPGWWVLLGMSVAIAALGARGTRIRAVADERGVRLINLFSSHRYAWDSIARFELTPGARSRAMLVPETGKHRSLAHLQVSPAEGRRTRSNHTQEVVETLQRLLRDASTLN